MKAIPIKLREEMSADPQYGHCMRKAIFNDHECKPDPISKKIIEWEHAMYYKGSQINRKWAIISICWLTHRGGMMDKRKNEYMALIRATEEDLKEYPRADFKQRLKYLKGKFQNA